jgi:hypothetical protein
MSSEFYPGESRAHRKFKGPEQHIRALVTMFEARPIGAVTAANVSKYGHLPIELLGLLPVSRFRPVATSFRIL